MNYKVIELCSLSNGPGWRVVLWVCGCSHHCYGCHNADLQNETAGKKFTSNEKEKIKEFLAPDYIQGITLSGGDPMYENNREEILKLVKDIKQWYPQKDIWMYTGYTFEEIKNEEILNYVDILVDGKFDISLRDITLKFRGSRNQRLIDVKKSLMSDSIVEYI